MLDRNYKLKKETDFKKVFQKGKFKRKEFLKIKFLKNNLKISRFALVIGLKVSKKAVKRNKIKRQIEEILRLNLEKIKKGFDIIILFDQKVINQKYQTLEENLISLLKQSQLMR